MRSITLSRRDFLKLSWLAFAGALVPWPGASTATGWLTDTRLGQMTEGRIRLFSRPHPNGREVMFKYRDDVVIIVREVVGRGFYSTNHVWFETPEGCAYSSWVQPVRFLPNEPLHEVPSGGAYVEVSAPFTDARAQPDPQAPIVHRLYYGSTYQIGGRRTAPDGSVGYRINDENAVKMHDD